jgi:pimeloyl-ACP methyl ester carboxylesterase
VTGSGPTLLLDLPGVGTEADKEVPLTIAGMTNDFRARFLRATKGQGPFGILAVSLGGMIALDWLARYPLDFEAGVVINTSAADLNKPWERLRWEQYGRIARYLFVSELEREKYILEMTAHAPHLNIAEIASRWVEFAKDTPVKPIAAVRQLLAASRSTLPWSVHAPTLVLTSYGDRLVSHNCSERIAQRLSLPIHHHPTAGHDLPLDDPQWVSERVAEFTAQLSAPAAARTSRRQPRP